MCSCLGLGIIWDELPCTATGWLAHMMTIAGPPLTAWNCLGPGGLVIVLVSKTWAASWDILGFDQTHLLTTAGHIGWTPSGNILQPCHPSYRIWFSKSLHWLAVDHAGVSRVERACSIEGISVASSVRQLFRAYSWGMRCNKIEDAWKVPESMLRIRTSDSVVSNNQDSRWLSYWQSGVAKQVS